MPLRRTSSPPATRAVSFPYGHQLAEECPADLAETYLRFFDGQMS